MFVKPAIGAKVTAILLGLLAASCQARSPAEKLVLQLNWVHDAEFAGFYTAQAKGFFAEEGLDVSIVEGGAGINARKALLNKDADLSVLGFGEHRRNIEKGEPAIAVMAVFQISPLVLIVHSDSSIKVPLDLVGRRVGIKDANWLKVIQETLRNVGAATDSFIPVEVGYDDFQSFYDRKVDVWTGFAYDEPNRIRMAGHEVRLIFPADYGVGGNEGLVVVREETLESRPETVERFVRAARKGWKYALEHAEETAGILQGRQSGKSLEFLTLEVGALAPLVETGQVPIGWIDEAVWASLLGKSYRPERPGFTTEFVGPGSR